MLSTERLNEMVIANCLPHGHQHSWPQSRVGTVGFDQGHLAVYGEPVPMAAMLYSQYTLLRGSPISFAQFYATPFSPNDDTPEDGEMSNAHLRQVDDPVSGAPHERVEGTAYSKRWLATEVIHEGRIPGITVEISGVKTLEYDDDMNTELSTIADRVSTSFSDAATAWEHDLAKDWRLW